MKTVLALAGALLVLDVTPALSHRVDEYLEAATILLSRERVRLDLRLAPGIAVASTVLDSIDLDRDGVVSDAEQQAYAGRVRDDLRFTLDGDPVALRLISLLFPGVAELKGGVGEIRLALEGDLPRGGRYRKAGFENRHRPQIAAYLVNSLVPEDRAISIGAQVRSYTQSAYQVSYEEMPAGAVTVSFGVLLKWGLVVTALVIAIASRLPAFRRP